MTKPKNIIPENLERLHNAEEQLREKAFGIVGDHETLHRHIAVVEAAMDLTDIFRQFDTNDENLKVLQILGMRTFNAFGASMKLSLSGYHQNSALILRDILETVFLLNLFVQDPPLIERWRLADKKERMAQFSPLKVREALDSRDGFTSKRRFEIYELFSELAGHPNMKSAWMMRPQKDGDAVIGPFMEATALEAVVSEMGRLAIQVGEQINAAIDPLWSPALPSRASFAKLKLEWLSTFYPDAQNWK
ncbi:hypothetical protein QYR00_07270 [Agrobacterium tumefaciens]|nr:hypothetical protein QYR00_07270 [Agrobacterium tumefaciens]